MGDFSQGLDKPGGCQVNGTAGWEWRGLWGGTVLESEKGFFKENAFGQKSR